MDKRRNCVILCFVAATLFYMVAVMSFVKEDVLTGVFWLCIGTVWTCLGSVKNQKKSDE